MEARCDPASGGACDQVASADGPYCACKHARLATLTPCSRTTNSPRALVVLQALDTSAACVDECPSGTAKLLQGSKPRVMMCVPEHRCIFGFKEGTKTACECEDTTCNDCTVKADGSTCNACDKTRFLVAGACVKNIECKGSKVVKKGVQTEDRCNCESAGAACQSCMQSKVGTSIISTCTSCKKLFMHKTQCVEDCPAGYANYGLHSKFGRKW